MAELSTVVAQPAAGLEADLVVVGCCKGESPPKGSLPDDAGAEVRRLAERSGWRGAIDQVTEASLPGPSSCQIALHGLGPVERLTSHDLDAWLDKVIRDAARMDYTMVAVVLPDHPAARGGAAVRRSAVAAALGSYRFEPFRSEAAEGRTTTVALVAPAGQEELYRSAVETAGPIARGVALTRDLANTPPNQATPIWMAEQATRLADRWGMRIQVLGETELAEREMGGMLAVGGGSANPSRLVRLEWGEGDTTVALVGKGITFDTGGISIKPAQAMDEMKYDKCGACTVLGILQAAAELEVPVRIRAYLALAENMPGGASYRPGDIIRCFNGKTVEVINTDAEGRLVLADAMAWAAGEEPDVLLEMSTLTGACVVALGTVGAGLYTPDDGLATELLDQADASGEYLWRLPLWPEFGREMEGLHGDLKNLGGRWGGANNAAAFLSNFVEGAGSWAHLDIAGPAYRGSDSDPPRGATGYGVATGTAWLLQRGARD